MQLNVNTNNMVELKDLKDEDGALITGATVTVTLKDSGDAEVAGETWPLQLNEVTAGHYRGIMSVNLAVQDGLTYYAEVTANAGAQKQRFWKVPAGAIIGR